MSICICVYLDDFASFKNRNVVCKISRNVWLYLNVDLLEDKQCLSVGGFDVSNFIHVSHIVFGQFRAFIESFCIHLMRSWYVLVFQDVSMYYDMFWFKMMLYKPKTRARMDSKKWSKELNKFRVMDGVHKGSGRRTCITEGVLCWSLSPDGVHMLVDGVHWRQRLFEDQDSQRERRTFKTEEILC